jgi:hypothetical protein
MPDGSRYAGQILFYGALMALIGYLSSRPLLSNFPLQSAQIKLSFAHGAERIAECRRLTYQEIAKLPPNERRPNTCGRERLPIRIQVLLDHASIYDAVLEPTGLSSDGPARVYQKFSVPPGRHEITARLRDSRRAEGFDYETHAIVDLKPLQNLAIDFKRDQGAFSFR